MKKIQCSALSISTNQELFHTGPSLDAGAMPALFYFSLSGPDSLCLPPYNQIVQFLAGRPIRVFSLNLPAHENGLDPEKALKVWAEEFSQGQDPIMRFLDEAEIAIEYVLRQRLVLADRIAVAGLSRGGFFAALLASRLDPIRTVLGFAPLTRLKVPKEFQEIRHLPLVEKYDLGLYAASLCKKRIRFYIGNRDIRVSTRDCFECIEEITEKAFEQNIRPAAIELIISPSCGQMGHGTPPEIFRQGADWIFENV
jgi:hypothetical protein